MITFKINGQSSKFPTVWPDVTYEQYIYHIVPRTITEQIHCFSGLPLEFLRHARINNIEKISIALSFMAFSPNMEKTDIVGPYIMPGPPEFESLAQFEDLRNLVKQYPQTPRAEWSYIEMEQEAEIYLTACAIYCQKIKDGVYNPDRVPAVKEELKSYSGVQVISNGAFFFGSAINLQRPSPTLFRRMTRRLKKLLLEFPGYQRTLDFLLRSSKRPKT